jgi:hypothetical protein
MARTMLNEYKTPDIFWCEAINTACHAINRLYLHKKLKKTSYELLLPLVGILLLLVLALGVVEDCPNRLLTGGKVGGNV